jgi:hypothetical protein
MTSINFNTEIKINSQHLYDSLISLLLDTISSRDYLDYYEITVNDILYDKDLKEFGNKYNSGKAKSGMYPIVVIDSSHFETKEDEQEFLENIEESVHYYSISDIGKYTGRIVNGYKSGSPNVVKFNNGVGLDFQEEGTHGFCQTFALINYLEPDVFLYMKKGRYLHNALVCINWVKKFVHEHDFRFEVKVLPPIQQIFFKSLRKRVIMLSQIAEIVSNKVNGTLFKEWFTGDIEN